MLVDQVSGLIGGQLSEGSCMHGGGSVPHGRTWAMHPDADIFSSVLFFSPSLLLPEIICPIKHLHPCPWLSLYFGGNSNYDKCVGRGWA